MNIHKLRWKLAYMLRNLANWFYDADEEAACESCWKIHRYEESTSNEDGCHFCPACVAKWQEEAA